MQREVNRQLYLDYIRGFMVLLVVLDHSMHAYSQNYSDFWFMSDINRSTLIDVWHLHNDAIMMPFLLALAGLFVFVSLERRGYIGFLKERVLRLGIPFVIGVSVVAGFVAYNKAVIRDGILKGFFDFWWHDYLHWENSPFENFIMGSFWFLYYLALLTAIVLILNLVLPWSLRALGAGMRAAFRRPVAGFITLSLISAVILGLSDMVWGAHWWFGFKPVFYLRRARFLIEGFCFFLGVGAYFAGFFKDPDLLKRLSDSWAAWLMASLVIGGLYTAYTLLYFYDGAYDRGFMPLIQEGDWAGVWTYITEGQGIYPLIRTTLLGFYIMVLMPMYLSLFAKFLNTPKPVWISLAACSYGIYIVHEPLALWMHVKLYDLDLPALLKFAISGGFSLGVSWLLVSKVLLKIKPLRRIL